MAKTVEIGDVKMEFDRQGLVKNIMKACQDDNDETGSLHVHFKRPYTLGMVTYNMGDEAYTAVGMAKVCWPDTWNKKKGAYLVCKRAAREIADSVFTNEATMFQELIAAAIDDALLLLRATQLQAKFDDEEQ